MLKILLKNFLVIFLFLSPALSSGQKPAKDISSFLAIVAPEAGIFTEEDITHLRSWSIFGEPFIDLYGFRNREGFIMATSSRLPLLILAFSMSSTIEPDDLPPAMHYLINEYLYQLSLQQIPEFNSSFDEETELQISAGVTPLLSSKWDQRCWYNDSCPADPVAPAYFCAKAPAGCVATTLAQIMKYYKWPLQGTGTKSYYSPRYGTIAANFGATSYNIAAMPDMIYANNPEVARLLWHAGVASQMNYGPFASGTGITDARSAMVNYFGYNPAAQIVVKSAYSDPDWKNLMRNEIDNGRPVFYSGVDQASGSGHAWVLDGYSGTDYFHCNWGWSGIADGYFLLGNLNPLANANYTSFQEAIIGIVPLGTKPVASFTANKTHIDVGEQVTFSDLSGGIVSNWIWQFPGGTPSLFSGAQPPPVIYSKTGLYDVTLIVSNGPSSDTVRKLDYVRVFPLAGFSVSQQVMQAGSAISFFDASESNSNIQSWQWHFFGGVPATSTQKNPQPVYYHQPGQYPVFLTVNDGTHSDQKTELKYITVYNVCDTLLDFYMPGWYVQPANLALFNVYQEDLDSLTPYHHQYISSGWDFFPEAGGNHFISATSLFTTPGTANNWLIFGPVTIPQNGAELQWKHKFPDHTKRDGYEIIISTTGHTHDHFTATPLFSVADNDAFTLGDTTWTLCSAAIDAASYANQQIWVGVHHNAHNMFYIALDDFRLIACDSYPLTADFFSFDTLISTGDTVKFFNFSSGTPDQLNWSFPGGTVINTYPDMPLVKYLQPGVYDVSLTAVFGSTAPTKTRTGYIEVKPVSVDEINQKTSEVSAVPNPFTESFFITGIDNRVTYQLFDLHGRIVGAGSISNGEQVTVNELPSGIYFLRVFNHQANDDYSMIRLLKI